MSRPVVFEIKVPSATGLIRSGALVEVRPIPGRTFEVGDALVLPKPVFHLPKGAGTTFQLELEPSTTRWAYMLIPEPNADPIYFAVPEGEGPIDFVDTPKIEPGTLEPDESAVPMWDAAVEAVELMTAAAEQWSSEASAAALAAGESEQSAGESAASAEQAAQRAEHAADGLDELANEGAAEIWTPTVNSDGTVTISSALYVDNGDGTVTFRSPADTEKVYTKDGVDEKIVEVIGGDEAVITAAAELAQSDAGLVRTTDDRLPEDIYEPQIAFAVVDEEGRRTQLEIGLDGRFTPYAAGLAAETLAGPVANQVGLADQDERVTEVLFSVVDENDRRTELEVGVDGKLTQRVIDSIAQRLEWPEPEVSPIKMASGPDIVAVGDSMTAGAGGEGTTYRSVLAALSGRTVHHEGVGGENSVTIAARMNATPLEFTFDGGVIPADTSPVGVTLRPIRGVVPAPLKQGGGAGDGFITLGDGAKVVGKLTRVAGTPDQYFFARKTAGTQITADRPVRYKWERNEARKGDIHIIWIGQNGPSNQRAIEDARALVLNMQAADKRFLVIPRPTSTDADDLAWGAEFGDRVVYARKYLVEFGLADSGITPTAQDLTDMANGTIPASLRIDGVHWNAAGYTVLGKLLHQKMIEMGWL